MAEALLSLETEAPRSIVRIDGVDYAFADFDDFTLADQHRLSRAGARIQALFEKDDLSEAEQSEVQKLADLVFSGVLPNLPTEVEVKIKPGARMRIILAFFTARAGQSGLNGQTQSQDSSDSMGDRPASG